MRPSIGVYYHFLSAKYALYNIERRCLKVTTFDDINDPFELLGVNVGSQPNRAKNRETRRALREWRVRIANKYGVLCFSDGWSNPLLWSHYADRHRGIGLGFSVDSLRRVNYMTKRMPLDTWNPNIDIQDILWTKFQHWEYEAEHRRFVLLQECRPEARAERTLYFCPFGPGLQLRRVVLGAQCVVDIESLEHALGEMQASVELVKARVAFQNFRVVPRRDLSLGR